MQLSTFQKDALQWIFNDGGVDVEDTLIHKNTINALHKKGLIAHFNYDGCKLVQLTDKGVKQLGR
jgi:hypothetical protein